jgi:peroxiredoxin Q/BCP
MLAPGETAPDFELRDHEDQPVSLSSYRGDHVVVYFYPRADTPGCTSEACGFRDAYSEFEARGVTVLGISDDPVDDIADFASEYNLPFRLLSDEDGSVSAAYDSYGEKNMFGNTFDGVFRNSYLIDPDGEIALAYEGVSPDSHAEEILDDLADLGVSPA